MLRRAEANALSAVLVFTLSSISTILSVYGRDCRTSWRRAWRDLTCQQQDDFLDAILMVKDSGLYDEFVILHDRLAVLTHGTAEFLPWHRWFTYQFEKVLQDVTGRCIYIPYWDWERDAEREWNSNVFHEDTFGTYGGTTFSDGKQCVEDGIANMYDSPFQWEPGIDDGPEGCVEREFLDGFSWEGESQIAAMITNYEQYADTSGGDDVNGFRLEFEQGPHMLVHGIIGGHMRSNLSPADPLFYLHHSNVDKMYTLWQDYWDHDECHVDDYFAPWHYEGDLIDDELPFRHREAPSWDFRMTYEDGSRAPPTPRDLMSNDSPSISVRYMNDHLAMLIPDYEPNPRLIHVAEDEVDIRCDRDDWRRKRNLEQHSTSAPINHDQISNTNLLRGNTFGFNDFVKQDKPLPCQQKGLFTLEEDQEEWDRLCQVLPNTTTVAERLALMAENTCKRRGNPRSDVEAIMGRMRMKMDGPAAAFECFHRPGK